LGGKLLPKIFVDLPKVAGVPLAEYLLKGLEGVPKDGCGKKSFGVDPVGTGDD